MENTPFFSIVMPVYNVENYLAQAIESVLAQTYGNFELILVDDCSPDGSPKICDLFAETDKRVSVLHLEENRGVSNARNVGQKSASGQYLMFMDSDDTVTKDLLSDVYQALQENPADVVVFGMSEDLYAADGSLLSQKTVSVGTHILMAQNQLREFVIELEKSTLYGYACNKFYKRTRLNEIGLLYREYALLEDLFYNVSYFQEAQSMLVLGNAYYHYRKVIDTHSRTAKFVSEYFDLHTEKIRRLLEQQEKWHTLTDETKQALAGIYARYIFSALQRNCDPRSGYSKDKRKVWLNDLLKSDLFLTLQPCLSVNISFQGILNFFLKHKNVSVCLLIGKLLYVLKTKFPRLFDRVK